MLQDETRSLLCCKVSLKDHKQVNKALTIIQSRERITKQDYSALNKLVSVLLPFKKAMQQIEGENMFLHLSCWGCCNESTGATVEFKS